MYSIASVSESAVSYKALPVKILFESNFIKGFGLSPENPQEHYFFPDRATVGVVFSPEHRVD